MSDQPTTAAAEPPAAELFDPSPYPVADDHDDEAAERLYSLHFGAEHDPAEIDAEEYRNTLHPESGR